jgi:F-type H+-transporting ATPase subunit epsilon
MSFTFEVVSPERLLLSAQVDLAEIPGEEGDMGILEGHAPMIVQLRGGVIRITGGDGGTQQFFIAGGFAEVTPERTAVLADEAVPLEELSAESARARLAEAEAAYEAAPDDDAAARELALRKVLSARAMVEAAGG